MGLKIAKNNRKTCNNCHERINKGEEAFYGRVGGSYVTQNLCSLCIRKLSNSLSEERLNQRRQTIALKGILK